MAPAFFRTGFCARINPGCECAGRWQMASGCKGYRGSEEISFAKRIFYLIKEVTWPPLIVEICHCKLGYLPDQHESEL